MKPKRLFIHREAADFPAAVEIASRVGIPAEIVSDPTTVFQAVCDSDDPIRQGKEILFLTRNKGPFLRECPGTREYTCCGYRILHIGTFCTMDCAYCILQAYFHPPVLQFFVNHTDLFDQLGQSLDQPDIQRIGTGEFTDSLIWEPLSDVTTNLIRRFSEQARSILELKTKTVSVRHLRKLRHRQKTILAWSLNTERIIAQQERGTTSLAARLRTAAEMQSHGYPLAFHFDPIVVYNGCETEYRKVVQALFEQVDPAGITWISLGTFRFMPDLKPIIQARFPGSDIAYGEFIAGLDGKMRYFKPVRLQIYRKIVSWIREAAPDTLIYFCMEDEEVWEKCLGFTPASRGGLDRMLDESAIRHCGLVAPASV